MTRRSWTARLAWLSLGIVPLSLSVGRFWPVYVAPAAGLVYQYRSIALYPADLVVVSTVLAWLAWRLRSRRGIGPPPESVWMAGGISLLAAAAAASMLTADDRLLALGVAAQLALLAIFCLAAADILSVITTGWVLTGVAFAVLGEAVLAIWQAAMQTTTPAGAVFHGWSRELTPLDHTASVVILPFAGRWLRSYGTFAHPNILGGYLALTLAVLAIAPAPGRHRLRRMAMVVGLVGLLLTFSRAAWAAVLLGAVVLVTAGGAPAWLARGRARLAAALLLSLLVVGALVRLGNAGSLVEQNSIQTRQFYDQLAWKVIARGVPVGAGNLVVAQQRLFGASTAGSEPAHDVLVITLAELGPLGLLAWLAIVGSLLIAAWRQRANPKARAGPLVAAAVALPLLLLDHYLWTQPLGRVLLVFALVMMISLGAVGAVQVAVSPAGHRPAVAALAMLGLKRGIDVAVASSGLIILAPLMGLLGLAVWLEGGTPVIFRARRVGIGGRPFTMYKFRTMAHGSDQRLDGLPNIGQGMVKIPADPRVTGVGSWLRRFSLDELPQLWNIVRGEMSLVGPRPYDLAEVRDAAYPVRPTMRPGLTGLWQVRARNNPSLAVRERYDLEYLMRWSPGLDLAILWETVAVVVRGEGGQVMGVRPAHSGRGQ